MSINISLSFELICLINWLLKNEKQLINALVKQALKNGFAHELEKIDSTQVIENPEELYATVIDFLLFLEKNLLKNLETVSVDTHTQEKILPVVQKLDADNIDLRTLWLSMQQTKNQLCKERHKREREREEREEREEEELENTESPDAITALESSVNAPVTPASMHDENSQAAEILFQKLLKNWKPHQKEPLN